MTRISITATTHGSPPSVVYSHNIISNINLEGIVNSCLERFSKQLHRRAGGYSNEVYAHLLEVATRRHIGAHNDERYCPGIVPTVLDCFVSFKMAIRVTKRPQALMS
jgi:hypothetical protein